MTMMLTPADDDAEIVMAASTETDAELSARFEREALPLREVLLRGARRLTHNEADAENLLQDTLLAAFKGFRSFRQGSNIQAWLFRIMQNRWINDYRRAQRRVEEVTLDGLTDRSLAAGAERTSAGSHSVESVVLEGIADDDVRAALAALPEGHRRVLFYTHVEGYTYAETAAILRIPMGTVMSRVFRGRQRLRTALAHRATGRYDGFVAEESAA